MIVSACFLPHSPLLLPTVAPEERVKLKKTIAAVERIASNVIASKPETMVILSSHGSVYRDAFGAELHDPYVGHFEEFGDFTTRLVAHPDFETVDRLNRHLRAEAIPMTLNTDASLDYGTTIALAFFKRLLPETNILPLSSSLLDLKTHFDFGKHAGEIFQASKRRISIVCTGDLSQRLASHSPAGFAPQGAEFDTKIQELLAHSNTVGLLAFSEAFLAEAGECALRPLLMTLGMIDSFAYEPKIESYESPFGVGYLAAEFKLS